MHAPTTMIREQGINRVIAVVAGIVLLAASALAAAVFTEQIDVPFTGGSSEVETHPSVAQHAELRFLEQNIFDLASRDNSLLTAGETQDTQTGVQTIAGIQYLEWSTWDYVRDAEIARQGEEPLGRGGHRFRQQNIWGSSSLLPHGEPGDSY